MAERVLVAMSGGVDSSVAAAMLVEQGYEVVGATMKLFCHGEDLPDRPCCSLDSVNDARRICQQLGVPHYVLNIETEFSHDVVDNFVAEYARGRTPIPCVRCNTFTKFRDLLRKADAIDASGSPRDTMPASSTASCSAARTATRISRTSSGESIERCCRGCCCPSATPSKAETRATAHRLGLDLIAEKVESQDICFVPDGDHTKIIRQRLGPDAPSLAPGRLCSPTAAWSARTMATPGYTIGQRRGVPVDSPSQCTSSTSGRRIAPWCSVGETSCSAADCRPGDELAGGCASRGRVSRGADPTSVGRRPGGNRANRGRGDRAGVATSRSRRSRPGNRWCCTMVSACWAAA